MVNQTYILPDVIKNVNEIEQELDGFSMSGHEYTIFPKTPKITSLSQLQAILRENIDHIENNLDDAYVDSFEVLIVKDGKEPYMPGHLMYDHFYAYDYVDAHPDTSLCEACRIGINLMQEKPNLANITHISFKIFDIFGE